MKQVDYFLNEDILFVNDLKILQIAVYLVSIHQIKCLFYIVRGQSASDLKIKVFIVVNDCFQIKCNEEIGLYRQTLFNEFSRKLKGKRTSLKRQAISAQPLSTDQSKFFLFF